jgi:hypothetical protein
MVLMQPTSLIIQEIHMNGSISNFNVISQNIMYFDVGGVSVFQGYQTYIIVQISFHFFSFMIGVHYMLH